MRAARAAVLGAWAVAAILLVTPAAAYYHFTHYASRVGPFQPMPEKFDLNNLPNKTLTFFVSDSGPSQLQPNDSFASVLGVIRQATQTWNGVDSSDLRVAFGGLYTAGTPNQSPVGQVIFSDDVPPGVVALGGPLSRGNPSVGASGAFIPITTGVVMMRRDLAQRTSYSEGFFLTLVHEMGHALGLQHTFCSSAMSTGITRATTRWRPIDTDDAAGLTVLYPKAGSLAQFGSIAGRVTSGGQPINLASVVALRPAGSAVSAVTHPDGTYRIDGLPPDTYFIYVHSMPPASQAGLGPGDVQLPVDLSGRTFAADGPIETLFFPGTRDSNQFVPLQVGRGAVMNGIDFSVQRRNAVAIYDVTTYSYFGTLEAKSAYMNSTTEGGRITVLGTGLIAGNSPVPGLAVQVLGGVGVTANPYTYSASGQTYLALDLKFPPFPSTGPRHLFFALPNDAYVLPNGLNLTQKQPPAVQSVTPNADGTVTVTGSAISADSRIYFDSLPGVIRSVGGTDLSATAIVAPPVGFSNQVSAVTIYNSDGQNSGFLQRTPPAYLYGPSAPAAFSIASTAGPLPAGASAMVDITGNNTNFVDGLTTLGFGSSDMYVRRVWVLGPNHLWANVTVAPNATPGPYTANVVTGFQVAQQPFSLQVTAANPARPSIALPPTNITGQSGIYAGSTVSVVGSNLSANPGGAGVVLTLNDQPVNVLFASPNQINFQIPAGIATGPALLKLNNGAADAFPVVVQIDVPPPVIAAVFTLGNTPIDGAHPAYAGEMVAVWLQNLDPATVSSPGRVRLNEGGIEVPAVAILPVPGQPNVYQAVFTLSTAVNGAQVLITVSQDGSASAPAFIPVR
jgi:uncharacterized protein (TIGR03437 family)